MFEKTRLYTPEGGFVAEVDLPPFNTKPEVLIWGARVFVHVDSFLDLTEDEDGCYVEAFAYYVPFEGRIPLYPPPPYILGYDPGRGEERPPVIDLLESTNMDAGDGGLPAPDHFINRRLEKLQEVKPSPPRRVRMIGEPFTCGYCQARFSFMGLDRNPQDVNGVTYCMVTHLRLAGGEEL